MQAATGAQVRGDAALAVSAAAPKWPAEASSIGEILFVHAAVVALTTLLVTSRDGWTARSSRSSTSERQAVA